MKRPLAASSLFAVVMLVGAAPRAEDIVAELRVDAVTVYPRSAAITRRGEVRIPAGEHRLIVRGLPDPVDPASLRVSAGARALRLGGVELERIIDTDFVNEAEETLRSEIQALQDERTEVQDDVPTAQTQLKLIDSLAAVPTDREGKMLFDGIALPATLDAIAAGAAEARATIRAANIAVRDLDRRIAALEAELQKVRTESKSTTEVRATVVASAAVTAPVSVDYRVDDAGWRWLYEARLDTQDETLALNRQAEISQGSGEDWQNAEVTVTTARPAADAGTPRIASLFLSLREPGRSASAGSVVEEIVVTGSSLSQRRRPGNLDELAAAPRITADEFATEFVTEYRIPGRVSIGADRQARVFPISEERFDPDLVARAVLPEGPEARLEASFNYGGDAPIEAGRVQLYRDGAYMGDATLPQLLPGADVRVPFGIDDRIRIAVRDERTESGSRGVSGRLALEEHRVRYEITSFHATALPIEIIDRVPVPQDSDIDIEVLDGATPPTVRDFDGKAGVYLWRLDGTPRETATIRHYYSVRYPSDMILTPTEGND